MNTLPIRRQTLALLLASLGYSALAAACVQAKPAPAAAPVTAATPPPAPAPLSWMTAELVAAQTSAPDDAAKEAVARSRAKLLVAAMTLPQKMQQLTGAAPELLPELPECYGGRHVSGIAALGIPTFRITNGPVGVGQNDCVAASLQAQVAAGKLTPMAAYTHPSSAHATALPSAMGVAASFDPQVAAMFGGIVAREMNNLGLHVFEAPGVNLARLPILGRNFEYFGEDPFLAGSMAVAETRSVQAGGLIAMVKHFVANEQETNRMTIRETVDRQALHELYLLPFEMAVKDGRAAAVMCSYNYVNDVSACENKEMLTNVLRGQWHFSGYVQSDFFAMKSTAETMKAGLDHEMPMPQFWAPAKLNAALGAGTLTEGDFDLALERRYTQVFKAGIFDRKLTHSAIDFAEGGRGARAIGVRAGVLLQNNGALPLAPGLQSVVVIGKASQIYAQQAVAGGSVLGKPMGAGGGSSDVVPDYTVSPIEGIRAALKEQGNSAANATLILIDDANAGALIDGKAATMAAALKQAAAADAVVIMAGSVSEEGADRASFTSTKGAALAQPASAGSSLDWFAARPNQIATELPGANPAASSNTFAMIRAIMAAHSSTSRPMAAKTVLVLKDNAGVAIEPALLGRKGPAILETWFPGQEDGNIVADLLFGRTNPSGKLPVTFPIPGRGFLDSVSAQQFPGVPGADGKTQAVTYAEGLRIGYRWYDANMSGKCAGVRNPCVAFPFGFGLSYTTFALTAPRLSAPAASGAVEVRTRVTNTGKRAGAEVVQVYLALPSAAPGLPQPPKRLVGFQRVELAAGASAEAVITIDPAASNHPLSVWDQQAGGWTVTAGTYRVFAGTSSSPDALKLAGTFSR